MSDITRRALLRHGALAATLLPFASPRLALAQEPYPNRAIKWVVPYLAGTGPDTTTRILADAVGPILGQPVIIDNRAGAAGNIGAPAGHNACGSVVASRLLSTTSKI